MLQSPFFFFFFKIQIKKLMCSELQSQDATSGFSGSDLELDAVTAHPDWCKRMPGLMGILKLGLMGRFWMVASKEQKEFNKWNSSHRGKNDGTWAWFAPYLFSWQCWSMVMVNLRLLITPQSGPFHSCQLNPWHQAAISERECDWISAKLLLLWEPELKVNVSFLVGRISISCEVPEERTLFVFFLITLWIG